MSTKGRILVDRNRKTIKCGDILECNLGRKGIFLGFGIFYVKTKKVEKRINNLCFKVTDDKVILTDWSIISSLNKDRLKQVICIALSQDKTLINYIQNKKNMLNCEFYLNSSFYEKRAEY